MFAGFQDKDKGSESAKKLKEDSSGRLHVLQLDVTSEKEILAAAAYVKHNLPHGTSGKVERMKMFLWQQRTKLLQCLKWRKIRRVKGCRRT